MFPSSAASRGFTLLELMMVMLVMAVVAAFVLPNLFRPSTASFDDSARRMVRMLHLAAEEAQLRGTSLRFNAWTDHYEFQLATDSGLSDSGQWQTLTESPFTAQALPQGVSISEVKLADGVQFYGGLSGADSSSSSDPGKTAQSDSKKDEQAPLGSIVLMPDGMLTLGEIMLHSKHADAQIELRPGPGGIRMLDNTP